MNQSDLRSCTVHLQAGPNSGTGFFVRPGVVVTCAHLVTDVGLHGHVDVGTHDSGRVVALHPDSDVAVLRVTTNATVNAILGTDFRLGDATFSYGYPKSGPIGDPITGTIIDLDGIGLLKFNDTFIEPGMSGAPLLNIRTGNVCGMVKATLRQSAGYAIPAGVLLRCLMEPEADFLDGIPGQWRMAIDGFITQYLGRPEHPVPFGGRDDDLRKLDCWLSDQMGPRYGLISARGGAGKSALLAHWVMLLQARSAPISIVYHPISARRQTNSASAVFQSLASRLAAIFGDPAPPTQDSEQLRELVLQYLDKANRESKELLVVLDALDEAAGWTADNRLFPPTRRGTVRVLVSARPLPGEEGRDWQESLGWLQSGCSYQFDLQPLSREGVEDVLNRMGNPLTALAGRLDIVDTLFRLSQGDPLVVSLYVQKLRDFVPSPQDFEASRLESMKPGLAGFFHFWFEDQVKLWGNDLHRHVPRVRALLSICSLAHGPVTKADVKELAPDLFVRNADLDATVQDLSRFLVTDMVSSGYVLEHPRLGDFIREEFFDPKEIDVFEQRFLDYGSGLISGLNERHMPEASPYIVRWYSTHLLRAHQPLASFRPLLTFSWYQLAEKSDGTPAGFLTDLDNTWEAASGSTGVGVRIRVACLRSSLLTQGRSIPLELFERCAKASIFSPTLAEVIARQQRDLAAVFLEKLSHCLPRERHRLLRESLKAARQITNDEGRASALKTVVARLDVNDRALLRQSLGVAQLVKDEGNRIIVLNDVVTRLEHGDQELLRRALEVGHLIKDDRSLAGLLHQLVARSNSDDREFLWRALNCARQISDETSRSLAIIPVVDRLLISHRDLLRAA